MIGFKPIDGGHYIFKPDEKQEFLQKEPEAAPFLHPYIGAQEFIQGKVRYILRVAEAEPHTLKSLTHVCGRSEKVRAYRKASHSGPTSEARGHPNALSRQRHPLLAIPGGASRSVLRRREYVPIGYLEPPMHSQRQLCLPSSTPPCPTSRCSPPPCTWRGFVMSVGGRLKSRLSDIPLVSSTTPSRGRR